MKEDRCTSNGTLMPKSAPLMGPGRHGPIVAKLAQIGQMAAINNIMPFCTPNGTLMVL